MLDALAASILIITSLPFVAVIGVVVMLGLLWAFVIWPLSLIERVVTWARALFGLPPMKPLQFTDQRLR